MPVMTEYELDTQLKNCAAELKRTRAENERPRAQIGRHREFLNWVADRLVHVYGESPNVDFVLKLRQIADRV
jgi:hypothetical protein